MGQAAGLSASTVSRIERGVAGQVSVVTLARLLAIVGLDLSARAFAGGQPIRDAAHARLLGALRVRLHRSLRFVREVPLPNPGDRRAWDAVVSGVGWSIGVEAETAPRDEQALERRLMLKVRDGGVDGALLLLPRTRRTAEFLAVAGDGLRSLFPVDGTRALGLLGAGVDPGGNAIVVIPVPKPPA